MSLDLSIAGISLPTNIAALKGFKENVHFIFAVEGNVSEALDTPLNKVPASHTKSSVSFDAPSACWTPLGSAVQFGLSGGAGGSIEVLTGGSLLDYTDGLESPKPKSVPIPAASAFLKLSLHFTVSGSGKGSWSGGAYGVKGSAGAAATFAITFIKAFAPSTPLRQAIAQTFESFVLPFHAATLEQMSAGDFLFYEFDGNLHVSFGAYAGLDKVAYAGQSSVEVLKCLGPPLANLGVKTAPTVKAEAALDFAFKYTGKFEVLLSKLPDAARLHLFRSSTRDANTTLSAELMFDVGTTASLSTKTQAVQDSLVNAAGGASSEGGKAMAKIASSAAGECSSCAADAADKLNTWLKKTDRNLPVLQAQIESSQSRAVLAAYTFDLHSPQYAAAWNDAVSGDFVAALASGAVALDTGSGLENEYRNKASFTCNFFDLWRWQSWSDLQSKAKLVYAGNNVFHFSASVGRDTETDTVGAMQSVNFYFTADAGVATSGVVSNPEIDLHLDTTAKADPKAAASMAVLLTAMRAGQTCDALAANMQAFAASSPKGAVQLQVSIPLAAYAHIQCDPYSNGKPSSSDTTLDAANWMVFAQAADDLHAWPLSTLSTASPAELTYLKSFGAWQTLNRSLNGSDATNRLEFGNSSTSNWPEGFPDLDVSDRVLVLYSMRAGQQFMNFCDALKGLVQAQDTRATDITWQHLLDLVTDAMKKNTSVDFIRPAALAIIRLSESPAVQCSGPVGMVIPDDHFAVRVKLEGIF